MVEGHGSAAEGPLIQLRLGFSPPARPVTVGLTLRGLQVQAEGWDRGTSLAWEYLLRAGVRSARVDGEVGVVFPVAELDALAELPEQVTTRPDRDLQPLVDYIRSDSFPHVPATLSLADGQLRLAWHDGDELLEGPLTGAAQAALLAADLPFVATADSWEQLEASASFPPTLGRASVNLDRFVEIVTSKPQVVEASPLPALFRMDDTRFGLPLTYASAIAATPGFIWEGGTPVVDRPAVQTGPVAVPLSGHHRADLDGLVRQLTTFRSAAVVWESGLGRRVFAMAAMETLDAFPLLVVTPPWGVWVWQRHAELFGRAASVRHPRDDVRIITYRDLAAHGDVEVPPYGVIFDELAGAGTLTEPMRTAVRNLDGLVDTFRVATDRHWPHDIETACRLADALRPGEFRFAGPLQARYPQRTDQRAREHLDCYLLRRSQTDPTTDPGVGRFRASQVRTVAVTGEQQRHLAALQERDDDPLGRLVEATATISSGTASSVSPKIAEAVRIVRAELDRGRTVAAVTFHHRSATLLRAALSGCRPVATSAAQLQEPPAGRPVVVHSSRMLPDTLQLFDVVVICDYPWSTGQLETACGASFDAAGPARVVLLHARDTVDDRIAMYAARRRELSSVLSPAAAPDVDDAVWLLSPRT